MQRLALWVALKAIPGIKPIELRNIDSNDEGASILSDVEMDLEYINEALRGIGSPITLLSSTKFTAKYVVDVNSQIYIKSLQVSAELDLSAVDVPDISAQNGNTIGESLFQFMNDAISNVKEWLMQKIDGVELKIDRVQIDVDRFTGTEEPLNISFSIVVHDYHLQIFYKRQLQLKGTKEVVNDDCGEDIIASFRSCIEYQNSPSSIHNIGGIRASGSLISTITVLDDYIEGKKDGEGRENNQCHEGNPCRREVRNISRINAFERISKEEALEDVTSFAFCESEERYPLTKQIHMSMECSSVVINLERDTTSGTVHGRDSIRISLKGIKTNFFLHKFDIPVDVIGEPTEVMNLMFFADEVEGFETIQPPSNANDINATSGVRFLKIRKHSYDKSSIEVSLHAMTYRPTHNCEPVGVGSFNSFETREPPCTTLSINVNLGSLVLIIRGRLIDLINHMELTMRSLPSTRHPTSLYHPKNLYISSLSICKTVASAELRPEGSVTHLHFDSNSGTFSLAAPPLTRVGPQSVGGQGSYSLLALRHLPLSSMVLDLEPFRVVCEYLPRALDLVIAEYTRQVNRRALPMVTGAVPRATLARARNGYEYIRRVAKEYKKQRDRKAAFRAVGTVGRSILQPLSTKSTAHSFCSSSLEKIDVFKDPQISGRDRGAEERRNSTTSKSKKDGCTWMTVAAQLRQQKAIRSGQAKRMTSISVSSQTPNSTPISHYQKISLSNPRALSMTADILRATPSELNRSIGEGYKIADDEESIVSIESFDSDLSQYDFPFLSCSSDTSMGDICNGMNINEVNEGIPLQSEILPNTLMDQTTASDSFDDAREFTAAYGDDGSRKEIGFSNSVADCYREDIPTSSFEHELIVVDLPAIPKSDEGEPNSVCSTQQTQIGPSSECMSFHSPAESEAAPMLTMGNVAAVGFAALTGGPAGSAAAAASIFGKRFAENIMRRTSAGRSMKDKVDAFSGSLRNAINKEL